MLVHLHNIRGRKSVKENLFLHKTLGAVIFVGNEQTYMTISNRRNKNESKIFVDRQGR